MNVHDSTIYIGDDWKAEDNFDSALDKDGNTVDFCQLTVDDSQVDTTKAGTYDVTYSYDGVTNTAKVTVLSNKSAITMHDSTLTTGDSWTPKDNFASALNKKGDKVPFDAITVDGTVDTSKAGVYKVTYSYKEATGEVELFVAQVRDTQQGTNIVIAMITVKDKAPVDPGNLTEPTIPTNPSSPNSPSQTGNVQGNGNNSSNQTAVSSNESLPQTGEKAGLNLVAIGAALLMALIGLLLFRKPKKSSGRY